MCASINDKNCNYRPCKSFITQNHLLIYGKKHRGKIRNTGKTQGILSLLECGHPVNASSFITHKFSCHFIFLNEKMLKVQFFPPSPTLLLNFQKILKSTETRCLIFSNQNFSVTLSVIWTKRNWVDTSNIIIVSAFHVFLGLNRYKTNFTIFMWHTHITSLVHRKRMFFLRHSGRT